MGVATAVLERVPILREAGYVLSTYTAVLLGSVAIPVMWYGS